MRLTIKHREARALLGVSGPTLKKLLDDPRCVLARQEGVSGRRVLVSTVAAYLFPHLSAVEGLPCRFSIPSSRFRTLFLGQKQGERL